ncbi:MAG: hypothetical protein IT427_11010 [Pirellulales bacterium]|nr:hypothetical protein [Pirellulales bacterium]
MFRLFLGLSVLLSAGFAQSNLAGNEGAVASVSADPSAKQAESVSAKVSEHVKASPATTVRLMSVEKERRLRARIPDVADADLRKILTDPRLILYTDAEIPRAYQFWGGGLQGIHNANYNISADGGEPYGNGNREFPWGHPAGTHRTKNVETVRFLWLPLDTDGKTRPVVWHRKVLRGDSSTGYAWTFPVGAVVGEILSMASPDGYAYTFEMRIRTREFGYWDVDVFRPFPTAGELVKRIKQLRPHWENAPNLVRVVEHLEQPLEMRTLELADHQPAKRTFDQSMGVDTLPPIEDDELVGELLTSTTFRSAIGEVWRESPSGVKAYAPTSSKGFNIVPAKYDGGFVQVDRTSCLRCHDSVNKPVTDFNPGRDWYGRIRGSDGIFSFHPFAVESISDNGYGATIHMRPEMEKAGVIAKFDPKVHQNTMYHELKELRD